LETNAVSNWTNDHAPATTASFTLQHITNVMIDAIVTRIYYKILTIEHIFTVAYAANCSLSSYVVVGQLFLEFRPVVKDFGIQANGFNAVFQ